MNSTINFIYKFHLNRVNRKGQNPTIKRLCNATRFDFGKCVKCNLPKRQKKQTKYDLTNLLNLLFVNQSRICLFAIHTFSGSTQRVQTANCVIVLFYFICASIYQPMPFTFVCHRNVISLIFHFNRNVFLFFSSSR